MFTNPGGEGKTREGLIQHIEHFQNKMPGCHFKTDRLINHHGECLAVWSMYKQDGAKIATGYNFVKSGADGRFSYMAGFFAPAYDISSQPSTLWEVVPDLASQIVLKVTAGLQAVFE